MIEKIFKPLDAEHFFRKLNYSYIFPGYFDDVFIRSFMDLKSGELSEIKRGQLPFQQKTKS